MTTALFCRGEVSRGCQEQRMSVWSESEKMFFFKVIQEYHYTSLPHVNDSHLVQSKESVCLEREKVLTEKRHYKTLWLLWWLPSPQHLKDNYGASLKDEHMHWRTEKTLRSSITAFTSHIWVCEKYPKRGLKSLTKIPASILEFLPLTTTQVHDVRIFVFQKTNRFWHGRHERVSWTSLPALTICICGPGHHYHYRPCAFNQKDWLLLLQCTMCFCIYMTGHLLQ